MAVRVLVPLLGEGVEEVTVTKWLKKEGDSVNELEPLLEVNTDKVDTEIPAPASGTVLKIMAAEGVPAKVGAVLAFIGKPGESVEGSTPATSPVKAEEQKPAAEQPATLNLQPSIKQDIGFISPVVAKIAAEHGVNLQQVQGTGLNGRITKNDVLNFVENGKKTVDHGPQTIVHRPPSTVSASSGGPAHQAHGHPQTDRRAHGHVQAYIAARADGHGSGYEPRGKTSLCQ